MRAVRQTVFVICILLALASAVAVWRQHLSQPRDELLGVLFCASALVSTVGVLGFITQFFARRASFVLASAFFGFFAGMVATNFIFNVVTGVTYPSLSSLLVGYGLMLLFLALAVSGLILLQIPPSKNPWDKMPAPAAGKK